MRARSSSTGLLAVASLATAMAAGCALHTEDADRSAPEAHGEQVTESDQAADTISSTSTYFVVTRRDTRRCAWPSCGGVFVKRVNLTETVCADGTRAAECHVADVDLAGTGLDAAEATTFRARFEQSHGLVRGTIRAKKHESRTVATLRGTEAWVGNARTAHAGVFFRVTDLGIRCFTFPCNSLHEAQLNSLLHADIAGLDLSMCGAAPPLIGVGTEALGAGGVLVAGTHRSVTGPAGTGKELVAREFYTRVTHARLVGSPCGGFAGVACAAGQFCDVSVAGACGGADLPGRCRAVAEVCAEALDPVCGCNGKTYGNDCYRQVEQVQLAHAGACATSR